MFVFFDQRITDVYSLQHTRVRTNADGTFDVVADNFSEEENRNVLKSFPDKASADALIDKIQSELAALEENSRPLIIDLRTLKA